MSDMPGAEPEAGSLSPAPSRLPTDDLHLVEALRAGDEGAFTSLLDRFHGPMMRVAMIYVGNHEVAEEVVQETWMGVLHGLNRFEGRSSLRTWIFTILANRAKTRGEREGRSIPFSSLWDPDAESAEPAVDPSRFRPADSPLWPGGWLSFPNSWDEIPENYLLSQETRALVEEVIVALPPAQAEVITLRDVEGWSSEEVCNVLSISETNQRVLLHRARAVVRRELEMYLGRRGAGSSE